ncbi:MAG TPA: hypothetical protein VK912_20045 [Longimicrobiales bacterium]|nr:hypothetical protein [Longimicrobiales bacterium]
MTGRSLALSRCLACARALPANAELEWLPVGRRVAFDAHRGRLWVICDWCAHWSLVPMDARWEAVEELEKESVDRGIVRVATENVALIALGSIQALRVGGAKLHEEAWWRFGQSFRGRHLRYRRITTAGGSIAAAGTVSGMAVLAMVPGALELAAFSWRKVAAAPENARRSGAEAALWFDRRVRYGAVAWRGAAHCAHCHDTLRQLKFQDRMRVTLDADGSVYIRCRTCDPAPDAGYRFGDDAGERLVRRILAYENQAGATDRQLADAVALIANGSVRSAMAGPLLVSNTPRERLVAVELVMTQRAEARALGQEIAELEARWRDEETIASIIDAELTPRPATRTP